MILDVYTMNHKVSDFRNKLINKTTANYKYCFALKVNNEASFFISSIPYCLRHLSGKVLFFSYLVFRFIAIKDKSWHNVIIKSLQRNEHSIDNKIFIMPFGQNTLTQECHHACVLLTFLWAIYLARVNFHLPFQWFVEFS